MKTTFKNLIYIALAFAIGVSINSACGDNLATQGNQSNDIQALIQKIDALTKEVNTLKEKVKSLEAGSTSSAGQAVEIDGLLINPNGYPTSKVDKIEYSNGGSSKYIYDEKGRISKIESYSTLEGRTYLLSIQSFNYHGKKWENHYKIYNIDGSLSSESISTTNYQ